MTLAIAPEPPDLPEFAALLAESKTFSADLYPPESNHMIGLDALKRPEVTFLAARLDGIPVGCVALVRGAEGAAELKRMFVAGSARGHGIGRVLLGSAEDRARRDGIGLIRLETGIHSHAALALYRDTGYAERPPFAGYAPDPLSVFMEKRLGPRA